MAGSLKPCTACKRHVRVAERSCPFCGVALALSEPIEELRLLTRLDRGRMVALGAVLSAAGIALGCRETVVAVYGAPAPPMETSSGAPSAAPPPEAPPSPATSVLVPAPAATTSASASPPKPSAASKPASAPTGAPAAAYGAPPTRGPGYEPSQP